MGVYLSACVYVCERACVRMCVCVILTSDLCECASDMRCDTQGVLACVMLLSMEHVTINHGIKLTDM